MAPRVGFIEGHGEEIRLPKDENITELIELMSEAEMEYGRVFDLVSKQETKKYDTFILGRPKMDISREEKDALLQIVKEGKSLLILGSRDGLPLKNIEELTTNFGFNFEENWIHADNPTLSPIIDDFKPHDITIGISRITYPFGCTLKMLDPKCKGILFATRKHMNSTIIKKPCERTLSQPVKGRKPVICIAEYGQGRIVAIGSYRILVNDALSLMREPTAARQTRKFILNVFNWLGRLTLIPEAIYPKILDIIYVLGSAILGLTALLYVQGLVGGLILSISLVPLLSFILDKFKSLRR